MTTTTFITLKQVASDAAKATKPSLFLPTTEFAVKFEEYTVETVTVKNKPPFGFTRDMKYRTDRHV